MLAFVDLVERYHVILYFTIYLRSAEKILHFSFEPAIIAQVYHSRKRKHILTCLFPDPIDTDDFQLHILILLVGISKICNSLS